MNIYMLCSGKENAVSCKFPFYVGRFSYVAKGNILLSEKLPHNCFGDMMVISMKNAEEYITPAIYDECRKRGYSSVFLDTDEPPETKSSDVFSKVSASLERRGIRTFCPLAFSEVCPASTPVADGAVTGGVFKNELRRFFKGKRRIAISLSRISAHFDMPASTPSGTYISPKKLAMLADTFGSHIFFSPRLVTNYFLFSGAKEKCSFALMDNDDTISKKLRLAKEIGFSDAFLIYREISDIARDIRI